MIVVLAENPISSFNFTTSITITDSLKGITIVDNNVVTKRKESKELEIRFVAIGSETCLLVSLLTLRGAI